MTENDYLTIAASTRIRLARNVSGYAFPCVINDTPIEKQLVDRLLSVFSKTGDFDIYRINELSETQKQSFVERYLISKNLAKSRGSAVAVSKDRLISVMLCEEDHVREQIIMRGVGLEKCLSRLSVLDGLLKANFNFAVSGNNYFTACPSNLGTGMRASVMLFLPAICRYGELDGFAEEAREKGLVIRGAFGEGSRGEDYFFQVSNEITYHITEKEIILLVKDFVDAVVMREDYLRHDMFELNRYAFADDAFRALAVLGCAVVLGYDELADLIAKVKLGISVGIIKTDNAAALDDLLVASRPATLYLNTGGYDDEGIARALFVRENIKKLSLSTDFS